MEALLKLYKHVICCFLCTDLCRVPSTLSRRFTLHISTIWTGRVASGSPYLYFHFNLGKLQALNFGFFDFLKAFARLSAVYGGTYMLNKPECKVSYRKTNFSVITCEICIKTIYFNFEVYLV